MDGRRAKEAVLVEWVKMGYVRKQKSNEYRSKAKWETIEEETEEPKRKGEGEPKGANERRTRFLVLCLVEN